MGSLSNLYISQSYQSLIHLGTDDTASADLIELQDGLGNSIGVAVNTAGDLFLSGSLTASLQEGYLYVGDGNGKTIAVATSSIATTIDTGSLVTTSSFNEFTQSINSYTQSNDGKWNDLESKSGSWITESETASFARYDVSNPWSADQNFTNITALSASFTYVQTTFETASTIYSSGSNQFGDASDDVQTLYGSTNIVNELTASGLHYPTADGLEYQTLQTDGLNNLYFDYTKTLYKKIKNGEATPIVKGTPLYVSGAMGDLSIVYAADAGNPLRMPATLIAYDNSLPAGAEGTAVILGLIQNVNTTGFSPGTEVYVGVGGGWTATRPTGSNIDIQPLGVVTRTGTNGAGIVLTQVPFDLPNLQTGFVWVGDGNNQPVAVATASFTGSAINTGSFATTGSNSFNGNQIITGSLTVSGSTAQIVGRLSTFDAQFNGNRIGNFETPLRLTFTSNSDMHFNVGADFKVFSNDMQLNGGDTFFIMYNNIAGAAPFSLRNIRTGLLGATQNGFGFEDANRSVLFAQIGLSGSVFSGSAGHSFTGSLGVGGNLNTTGTLTASLQEGYFLVGNSTGRTEAVPTASISTDISGLTTTASFNAYTQSNDAVVNSLVAATSSYQQAIINPTLNPHSGSLILVGHGYASASFDYISSSADGLTNLIFKSNDFSPSTIISGSGNIFNNPSGSLVDRSYYVGGNSNLFLNNTSLLPTITSSAALVSGNRPQMLANIVAGQPTWNINQSRNPGNHSYLGNIILGGAPIDFNFLGTTGTVGVTANLVLSTVLTLNSPSRSVAEVAAGASGSIPFNLFGNNFVGGQFVYNGPGLIAAGQQYNINTNTWYGSNAFNLQSGSRGYAISNNSINAVTINDNTVSKLGIAGGINNIGGNNITSTTITNAGSASMNIGNNYIQQTIINSGLNAAAVTTPAQRTFNLLGNIFIGTNRVELSGSMGVVPYGRSINNNLILGQLNSASVVGDGSSKNLLGTSIIGAGLNVYGTSNTAGTGFAPIFQNYGSAFFGRWNAEDGNRANSAETIFAVGTGVSGSTGIVRKTGFLIDSGSNTFVEGTLNVSGSTTVTGSVTISDVIQLGQLDPLPAGADGQLAVSASNLWFYSGSAWNQIAFV